MRPPGFPGRSQQNQAGSEVQQSDACAGFETVEIGDQEIGTGDAADDRADRLVDVNPADRGGARIEELSVNPAAVGEQRALQALKVKLNFTYRTLGNLTSF